jgi:hypothetical protein
LAAGGGAGALAAGGGGAGAAAAAFDSGFTSSSAMMRRIDARISSIEGSCDFAGCVMIQSTASTPKLSYRNPAVA